MRRWIWSILDPDVFFLSKDFRLTFIVKRDTIFLFFHRENTLKTPIVRNLLDFPQNVVKIECL